MKKSRSQRATEGHRVSVGCANSLQERLFLGDDTIATNAGRTALWGNAFNPFHGNP